ncbi:MAG: site-specific DNA-methyltransferase [Microbacterium sp.]
MGDNLDLLGSIGSASAQLVYMDPPFASGREYKAVLQSRRDSGTEIVDAFSDTWSTRASAGGGGSQPIDALLGGIAPFLPGSTAAYLRMMAPRICEAWRILDERGSLYLHCDPSASHYLKMLLDVVFGPENFRSEIIWRRTHAHSGSRRYGPVHDVVFFYSKTDRYIWNQPFAPYSQEYLDKYYTRADARGSYQLITCTGPGDRTGTKAHYVWRGKLPPPGRHWAWQAERMEELDRAGLLVYSRNGTPRLKRYVDEAPGVALQDVWTDIGRLDAHSAERVGYETQKPVALLRRIIEASSEPGSLVVDPFAGSGTTAVASEQLGRAWAVGDSSLLAASLTLSRVRQACRAAAITLSGFPASSAEAARLRRTDPTTYGAWGTSILGAEIDRQRSSGGVTKGRGVLVGGGERAETRSWVPLGKSPRASHVEPADVPPGVRFGLVLDAQPSATRIHERLRTIRSGFEVIGVPVEDAVSPATRMSGFASLVSSSA